MRKLTRNEKIGLGVGGILVAVIIWLLLRRARAGAGGTLVVGPATFGGYNGGDYSLNIPPDIYNLVLGFQLPSEGVMAGGGETPCDCGCESNIVNFLDLSGFASALQDDLDIQTIAGIQHYFSLNPEMYAFANVQPITLFQEGYEGPARIRTSGIVG
jgi:hypothetical protein